MRQGQLSPARPYPLQAAPGLQGMGLDQLSAKLGPDLYTVPMKSLTFQIRKSSVSLCTVKYSIYILFN